MQAQDQARRFMRFRFMAEIFGTQFSKAELFLARHFPQKIEIDICRNGLRICHEFRRRRCSKLQQDILGAHLAAFTGRHFNLVCLALLRHRDAGFEVTGFIKK
ncbi:hypothetical protein D3C81_1885140 [compost metagenome]